MKSEHLPEKYYDECNLHSLPNEWNDYEDSLTDEEYNEKFEEYWDEHFYAAGDDSDIVACEDSFKGMGCAACEEALNDFFVAWPCPEAVINDYVIEQALQKSQNPLQDSTRPETLTG